MTNDDSNKTARTGETIVGGVALATLILADNVTALHPLFGLPLLLYLIRDFKKPSSFTDRLIISMALSFVSLLFTCYPIEFILDKLKEPPDWDFVLMVQWFIIFPFVWAIRAEFEIKRLRG